MSLVTHTFALVVVRRGTDFLLVHELKHGGGYYFPAGRVEPGESIERAAHRETMEEAGIPIVLTGIYKVQHTALKDYNRLRIIFLAQPADSTPPRDTANEHTLGAMWWNLSEIRHLPVRGREVLEILMDIEAGAPIHSLSVLGSE